MRTALLLLLPLAAASFAQEATIEGSVVKSGGEPVPRAAVTLQQLGAVPNPQSKATTTDDAGKFSFTNLAPGRYAITVERHGFLPLYYGQRAKPLDLAAGQHLTDLKLTLSVGGVLAGRVSDDFDEPISNASIGLFRVQYSRNGKQLLQVGTAKTDDRGEYRIFDIARGRYLLQSTASLLSATPAKSTAQRFISTVFYPGTMDPKSATWIEVNPGIEQRGLDFRLRPVPTVRVRGQLKSPTGQPAQGYLRLQPLEGLSGLSVGSITANAREDGLFEFGAVVPGRYLLLADQSANGSVRLSAKLAIQVGAGDLENVAISTQPSVRVQGSVKFEKGSAKANNPVAIGLQATDNGIRGAGGGARANADGTFVMENVVPDSYELLVYGLEPDAYVKSMLAGALDLFERDLVLAAEGLNIQIEIAAAGGKIEGTVFRSGDAFAASAQVVLMPLSGRNVMMLSKQAQTDEAGHFSIRGIAPGNYEMYAWAEIENGRWWDPEFLNLLKPRAKLVTVEPNATANVKLTILE